MWSAVALIGLIATQGLPPNRGPGESGPPRQEPSFAMCRLDGPVFRVGGAVAPPEILSRVEPTYSPEAFERGYEGYNSAEVVVAADGTPCIVRIVRGLGFGLDERMIDAVRQWRFVPGTNAGEPVHVVVMIRTEFRLSEGVRSEIARAGNGPVDPE